MASPHTNIVDIALVRGLRQDQETVLMPQGGLSDCNDVTFDKSGRLKRRGGFRTVSTTNYGSKSQTYTGPTERIGMGADGELLAFTDVDTFCYLPLEDKLTSAGQDDSGAFPSTLRAQVLSRFNVGANQAMQLFASDCASVTGHAGQTLACVLSTLVNGSLHVIALDVFDPTTNARMYSGFTIDSPGVQNAAPRLVAVGSVLFVIYSNGNAGVLKVAKFDFSGASPVYTSPANLVTDGDGSNTFFDAAPSQGGLVLVYRQNSTGVRPVVKTYNTALVVQATYTWTNSTAASTWSPPCLAICGALSTTDRVYAIGYDPGNAKVEFLSVHYDLSTPLKSGTVVTVSAANVAIAKSCGGSPGAAFAQWCENRSARQISDPRGHVNNYFVFDNAGTLVTTQVNQFSYYTLGSRVFRDSTSNALYSLVRFNDPSPSSPVPNAQNHLLLVDWGTGSTATTTLEGTGTPQAHVASGLVPLVTDATSNSVGGVADLGGGKFLVTSVVNIGTTALYGQQVACYVCKSLGQSRYLNTQAHNVLVVGGGTPLLYDGARLAELGFYSYPAVGAPCALWDTTGGSMLPGVYQYRFTWEWVDAQGQLHQSDACPAFTVDISQSATTTNRIRFVVPCLTATRKQRSMQSGKVDLKSSVRLVGYRTTAGGTAFHRVSAYGINVQSTTAGAQTVSLTDVDADSTLLTGTDTASAVNTSSNKTLRVRVSAASAYTAITVTSGASTAKTQIVNDLNAAFITNGIPAYASLSNTTANALVVSTNTQYLDIDSVANGSNLNTAVGYPSGGQVVTGAVSANALLYVDSTGANELPNTAPPPSVIHCVQGSRVWGVDAEYPERVWCTKTFVDGIAPSYSSALQVLIPGISKVNGIAAQDDKVFALGTGGVYIASYGDGPDNTGTTGVFASPQLVSNASNCDEPRSVVVGDDGIYFTGQDQASTTVYFLARGNASPNAIGNRVRGVLTTAPVCRGAVFRQEYARMEFLFVDNDTTPTLAYLVYYHYKLKDEEGIGQFTRATPNNGSAVYCIGDWALTGTPRQTTVLGYSGIAVQDDAQSTDPNGSAVLYSITTGDIRPAGIAGYIDDYATTIVGTTQAAADDFILKASYDSGVTFEQTEFAVSETSGPMLRRWEAPTHKLPYGSVLYSITQNVAGAGTILHAIVLEAVPLGGVNRLPASKQA